MSGCQLNVGHAGSVMDVCMSLIYGKMGRGGTLNTVLCQVNALLKSLSRWRYLNLIDTILIELISIHTN